jgi:ribosomal protein S18 acetylase RimI-like enzyme
MKILSEMRLDDGLSIAEVDEFPLDEYQTHFENWMISEYPFLPWREHLSEEERARVGDLASVLKNRFELRLAVLQNGSFRGWSFGFQESAHTFYMANSAVDPELRRKGLYSEMLKITLKKTAVAGFQTVASHHLMNNNPVIIAKLKAGFVIRGVELDPLHGMLLKMNYHHNELIKSAVKFRVGATGEPVVKDLLSVDGPKPKLSNALLPR